MAKMPKIFNARKVSKGTSYKAATGSLAPNDQATPNVELGSGTPVPIIEFVPELVSPYTRMLAYNRMMTDTGVDVSVRAAKTPILGAEFFVDPYGADPQDAVVAQFITDNLFGGMDQPFVHALEDILRMFEDGYSVLEKVHELREWTPNIPGANNKTYTMLKQIAPRPISTIAEIDNDDNGRPLTITQNAIRADKSVESVPIDISKLLIFTHNRRGGDITGKSILRTAYAHWFYKTHFYKIDAIQKERHGIGVPRGKLLTGYTEKDQIAMRTLLRNLRANEEAFILQVPTVEVDFVELTGNPVNVIESIVHHNAMILLNVLAEFLSSGLSEKGSGGRSTAQPQVDIFMKSLRYVAGVICDVINMYVIPELVVWNFPTNNFPQLKVRNIGETKDLQQLGAALANLISQGGIQMDDPTENWIRRIFDMPARTTPRTADTSATSTPNTNGNGNGNGGTSSPKGSPKGARQGNMPSTLALEDYALDGVVPLESRMAPASAIGEMNIHLPNGEIHPVPDVTINHEHEHQIDVHNEAPEIVLHNHLPGEPSRPIQTGSIVTKLEDGKTRIDYIFGNPEDTE